MITNPEVSTLRLRGRNFTCDDLKTIQRVVRERFDEGRWRISLAVCEALGWFQENGWPKDRACREVLNILDERTLIQLPTSRGKIVVKEIDDIVKKYYGKSERFNYPDVHKRNMRAVLAKSGSKEKIWNELIREHHYLGHTVQVGRTLKFLLYRYDDLIGGFSLADAAYNVAPRDIMLKKLGYSRPDVVNNSRFLLIPAKSVKNDASQILSLLILCAKLVWPAYYGRQVKLVETFVDTDRFIGTSYKAANWFLIGKSRGFKKTGALFSNGQSTKLIFLYPTDRRDRLKIEKSISL